MKKEAENPEKHLAQAVGAIIASRRKAKGLTQAQLAEQMDIEKETVSRLETGHISPTLIRLAQLAQLLDCNVSDFFQASTPVLANQALSLVGRMENLSDSQQEMLIQLFTKIAIAMGKLTVKDRKVVEHFLNDVL